MRQLQWLLVAKSTLNGECFKVLVKCSRADDSRGISYADLKTNRPICQSFVSAMRAMGHHALYDNAGQPNTSGGGSTDMGMNFPERVAPIN